MTVYTWKVEAVPADLHQGSRRSYGLPPIEWFSHLRPGTETGKSLQDIRDLAHIRAELLVALQGSLLVDPVQDTLSEVVVEVLRTGYSLYRWDYYKTGIRVSRVLDVVIE